MPDKNLTLMCKAGKYADVSGREMFTSAKQKTGYRLNKELSRIPAASLLYSYYQRQLTVWKITQSQKLRQYNKKNSR